MPIRFDVGTGAYVDTRVARGFPMGGLGTGGFSFNTDGSSTYPTNGGSGQTRLTLRIACSTLAPMGVTYVRARLRRPDGRTRPHDLRVLVDSGAIYSVLPENTWRALRELAADQRMRRHVVVSLDARPRRTDSGYESTDRRS